MTGARGGWGAWRGLVVAGVTVLGSCGSAERATSVILVSIDTLRADRVGLYGYERDTTPYLDRLAEQSLVYQHAYSAAPFTLTAHMTMLTGLHPGQHGILDDGVALSPEFPMLAERLRDAGFQTTGLYFPGWIDERFGFGRGFDTFRSHADAEEAGEHFAEWLADLDPARPFFLFLHLFDVHSRSLAGGAEPLYDPPPPYDRMFLPDAPERLAGIDRRAAWNEVGRLDEAQLEALGAMYDGGIRYVDSKLEAWVEELRGRGLLEHSLLVVTSDHGEALGLRNGVVNSHGGMFQEGLRVPLLVRLPGPDRPGQRVPAVVGLVDLVPTVLARVGLDVDARLPGYGLPLGRDVPGGPPADRIVQSIKAPYEVLYQWPWKLAKEGELCTAFQIELDPLEQSPVVGRLCDALRARMDATLATELESGPAGLAVDQAEAASAAELEALRQLGYGASE